MATFKQLLWKAATRAGFQPDSAAGAVAFPEQEKLRLTALVNDTVELFWRPPNKLWAWPETVAGKVVDVVDGRISRHWLGCGDWWTVWTEDPRPLYDATNPRKLEAKRVKVGYDGTWLYPKTEAESVWVFYRQLPPKFTATPVDLNRTYNPLIVGEPVIVRTAYEPVSEYPGLLQGYDPETTFIVETGFEVGDVLQWVSFSEETKIYPSISSAELVYVVDKVEGESPYIIVSKTPGGPPIPFVNGGSGADQIRKVDPGAGVQNTLVFDELGDGHVYMALAANALGSDLTDAEKWERQELPDRLVDMVLKQVEAVRLQNKSDTLERSFNWERQAANSRTDEFEAEIDQAQRQRRAPWLLPLEDTTL